MSASTQCDALAHIDLCSGIGGFAYGFELAGLSKPVMFCDIEPYCRKILRKHWPDVPIAEDVKELANDPDGLIPDTDPRRTIITAGYPCQPFSVAGARRGTEDDRHIWPHILSIVQGKRPSWCVFENVYGHVSMGLDEVLSDLEREGYAARSFIVPACGVDAPHRRDRLWIIARNVGDTERSRQPGNDRWQSTQEPKNGCADVAHADSEPREAQHSGCLLAEQNKERTPRGHTNGGVQGDRFWLPEPRICRVSHGVPNRVDRLRGLGNAIVPQIAMQIGKTIREVELQNERINTV